VNIGNIPLTVPTSAVSLYSNAAVWKDFKSITGGAVAATTYTVTFNSNSGSAVSSQAVAAGGKVAAVAPPTRSGYTFAGWYSNAALTTLWDFNTSTVTGNITLYAKWIAEGATTYTVTFNSNGGSAVSPQAVATGGKVAAVAPPTRSGYTFAGWYSNAAFTTLWDFGASTVTGNITLYAKWIAVGATTYTVTFNTNGGSAVSPQTVEAGGRVAVVTPPTRSGYIFDGWYSNASLTFTWNFNTTVTGNTTLYARWRVQPATGAESHTLGVAKVYPNPTSGMVTIENNGAEVLLYSLQGTLLERTSGSRLDLSGYPAGVYVLKSGSKTARIVKQ
jgi:uncharacterized repeat protein (TIGR02543 family)